MKRKRGNTSDEATYKVITVCGADFLKSTNATPRRNPVAEFEHVNVPVGKVLHSLERSESVVTATISERNTSKLCCCCHMNSFKVDRGFDKTEKRRGLQGRNFKCLSADCRRNLVDQNNPILFVIDRDLNASINIGYLFVFALLHGVQDENFLMKQERFVPE